MFEEFFDYPDDGVVGGHAAHPPVLGASWSDDRWRTVLGHSTVRHLHPGEHLLRAGEVERAVYVVTRGSLEVRFRTASGTGRARLEEGTVLGEVGFFDGRPRSSDVVALTDVEVRRFSDTDLERLATRHPPIAHAFLIDLGAILAHRFRRAQHLAKD